MAFTLYGKQAGGHSGEISIGSAGEVVEIWIFMADNGDHTPEHLRNSGLLPRVYEDYHPQNSQLLCRPHKIDQNDENPALFTVTMTWTSEPLDPKEKEQKDDNPVDRDPKITVKTGFEVEYRHTDLYGKPKTNSGGDLFDPPTPINRSHRVINIRKNVSIFPDWIFDFADSTNATPVMIRNRMFPKGHLYMASVGLGEETPHPRGRYCESAIEIWHKLPREPRTGEDPSKIPDPWQSEVLDEGLHGIKLLTLSTWTKYRIMIPNPDGAMVYPAGPVPLDGTGTELLAGSMTPEQYISALKYKVFRDHREKEWNAISYLWSYRY